MPTAHALAHDGHFWRKLAHFGATRGPDWWVRYSPAAFGIAAALVLPKARRAVLSNLRAIRGEASWARDVRDVAETFAAYAGSLAEGLTSGSKNARAPTLRIVGRDLVTAAIQKGKGVILVTAHSGGWEAVGPLLQRDVGLDLWMVMEAERDADARKLHDASRAASGVHVEHVGRDPLSALGLFSHVRRGGAVAIQIDRVPDAMKSRHVTLLGAAGKIPEGPLRIAQATGAPVVPMYFAREGYRKYVIQISAPVVVPRKVEEPEMNRIAQYLADTLTAFLREYPTQWFHFEGVSRP